MSNQVEASSRLRPHSLPGEIQVRQNQDALREAERLILDLADYVYAHSSLKPISKTLYLLTRGLAVAKMRKGVADAASLTRAYRSLKSSRAGRKLADDFAFDAVVRESEASIPRVLHAVNMIAELTADNDSLGLVFDTLLRGKFEGGEGMGTFLTPEEVALPMVDMLFDAVDDAAETIQAGGLFGDVCGGTGRFVYATAQRLREYRLPAAAISRSARLFDQSTMAVDMGRLDPSSTAFSSTIGDASRILCRRGCNMRPDPRSRSRRCDSERS